MDTASQSEAREPDSTTVGEGEESSSSSDNEEDTPVNDLPLPRAQRKRKRKPKPRGKSKVVRPYAIRYLMLSQFASLARSQDSRDTVLADCFYYEMESLEPHTKAAVVAASVTRKGKTNQNGHGEFLGFLRNPDPSMCPVGAMALLLFARWELAKEKPPSFEKPQDWYNIPLSVTGALDRKMKLPTGVAYPTHRRWFKAALVHGGVSQHRKVTHICRASRAKDLMSKGLAREEVMGHARWLRAVADKDYITELTPKALLAGANVPQADLRGCTGRGIEFRGRSP